MEDAACHLEKLARQELPRGPLLDVSRPAVRAACGEYGVHQFKVERSFCCNPCFLTP